MHININNTTIHTPDSWNDCTIHQLLVLYSTMMQNTGNLLEAHELLPAKKIFITQHLMGVDNEFLYAWETDCLAADSADGKDIFLEELQLLTNQVTAPFFEEVETEIEDAPKQFTISLSLTKCPYPIIKGPRKKGKRKIYYAAADGLENITIYELGHVFTLFENYIKAEQAGEAANAKQYIHELLATLYREPKAPTKANKQSGYEGDRRLPLLKHESMVSKRAEQIKFLPEEVKQLLLFWFASCRKQIIDSYQNVFKISSGIQLGGNQYGWAGTLMALADGLVNQDAVSEQNAHNALIYLSYLEDQRKLKELKSI